MRPFQLNILIANMFFGMSFLAGDRFFDRFGLIGLGAIWLLFAWVMMGD